MPEESRHEVTQLLARLQAGEDGAQEDLLPLVYSELHRLANREMRRQDPGHTLQATALVNEALLRLLPASEASWESRAHFFAVAAKAMRRILVDHARAKNRLKRKPPGKRVELEDLHLVFEERSIDPEALDHALEELAELDERMVRLVELRFYGGRTMSEAAEMLGMSKRTAEREWSLARAWLRGRIE